MIKESNIKVAHYYDRFYPQLGGAETHIANIIKNIPEFQFEVITNQFHKTSKIEKYGNNCIIKRFGPIDRESLESRRIQRKIDVLPSMTYELIRVHNKLEYLRKSNNNLIHIHAPFLSNSLFYFDVRHFRRCILTRSLDFSNLKKPCLITIHGSYLKKEDEPIDYKTIPIYDEYLKRLLRHSFEIIVVENYLYYYFKKYLKENNIDKKIYLIHNSVDTDLYQYKENKIEEKLKVLFVGRLEKSKYFILEFLDNLPEFIEFEIVGAGTSKDFMEIEKRISGKKVKLHKNISSERIVKLYQNANIIWNPVAVESITRVTLEAMSCGRPVIMINKGDRTPVIHGKTGFLVDTHLDDLISVLGDVYNNEELLKKLGENSREIIESNYSNNTINPKIKKIYCNLINSYLNY